MEQHRSTVGRFYTKTRACGDYQHPIQFLECGPIQDSCFGRRTLDLTRKAAALALILVTISPACLGSLLLIGGVESNPGPDAVDGKRSVLAALCAGAPTADISDCLHCYDVTKSMVIIERKLNSISVPTLVSTMSYLGNLVRRTM